MNMTSNCDVTNSAHQIQMTSICHWMKPPMESFCVRHCFQLMQILRLVFLCKFLKASCKLVEWCVPPLLFMSRRLQCLLRMRSRDERSHIFQTPLLLLAWDSCSDSEKNWNINSDSCWHFENFQVTQIKKVVSILPNEEKYCICRGYFAFDRTQMVEVVTCQAQYRQTQNVEV